MTLGAWRRWGSPPTAAEMAKGICDQRRPLWEALTGWLRVTYGLDGELAWTDEDSGWVLRYRRNGRALTTLLPNVAGGFSALVVVSPSVLGDALAAPLSDATMEVLETATPYADGRWLWLRVGDRAVVADVETLLRLKAPPPARALRRVAAVEDRDLVGTR
jgi:Protein of unknown function (DUF3788)